MRILIADDEELVTEMLQRSLKNDTNIVDVVSNGEEAVTKAQQEQYDVLILDVLMPKKNGIDACKELRSDNYAQPIIMLTSRGLEDEIIEALNAGADDYMTKPFSYKELEARIRAVTRSPIEVQSANVYAGPLTLNQKPKTTPPNPAPTQLPPQHYPALPQMNTNKNV